MWCPSLLRVSRFSRKPDYVVLQPTSKAPPQGVVKYPVGDLDFGRAALYNVTVNDTKKEVTRRVHKDQEV